MRDRIAGARFGANDVASLKPARAAARAVLSYLAALSDIVARPGSWTDSRVINMGLNLDDLLDPASPQHATWRRRLDRVAAALAELRDAGVVVHNRHAAELMNDRDVITRDALPRFGGP